jgi:hypothetical protein
MTYSVVHHLYVQQKAYKNTGLLKFTYQRINKYTKPNYQFTKY